MSVDTYRYFAGLADKIEGAVLPIDKPDMHVFTRREPIGVVAAIVPWNAQMFLAATKLGPALAAGCSVVLKASEIAPAPDAGICPADRRGRISARRCLGHHRRRGELRHSTYAPSGCGAHRLSLAGRRLRVT